MSSEVSATSEPATADTAGSSDAIAVAADSPPLPTKLTIEKTFSLPGIAFCIARGSDASFAYAGLSDFAVYRFDPTADKVEPAAISASKHNSYVTGLIRIGTTLISASYDGSLIWWNTESGDVIRRIDAAHTKWIRMLAATPDGATVASVGDDMRTRLWNVEAGERIFEWHDHEVKTPHGYPSMLYAVAVSPDGRWLATGDRMGHVLVRDISNGSIAATIETPVMYTWDPRARRHSIGGIRSLAFSRDSTQLAVGGVGKIGNIDHLDGPSRIEVFLWEKQERRHEIEDSKFKGLVESLQFGPGDAWLVAAGGDHNGFISAYNMQDGKLLAQEKSGTHVHACVLDSDTGTITTVGHNQGTVAKLA